MKEGLCARFVESQFRGIMSEPVDISPMMRTVLTEKLGRLSLWLIWEMPLEIRLRRRYLVYGQTGWSSQ